MVTKARLSKEYLALLEYVREQPDGAVLLYTQVMEDTGVEMDQRGKNKLRNAILRNDREYSVIHGQGYQLASAAMALGIVAQHMGKVDRQMKRQERAHRIIDQQFIDDVPDGHKDAINYLKNVSATCRLALNNGKMVFKTRAVTPTPRPTTSIPIPPQP